MILGGYLELHTVVGSTEMSTFIRKYTRCVITIQIHLTDDCLNKDGNSATWSL